MSYGQDSSLIYMRNESEPVPYSNPLIDDILDGLLIYPPYNSGLIIDSYIIGFCGKLYPLINFTYRVMGMETITKWCYREDDVTDFFHMSKRLMKNHYRDYLIPKNKDWWKYDNHRLNRDYLRYMFEQYTGLPNLDIFVEMQVPIFMISQGTRATDKVPTIITNPCLKDKMFMREIDTVGAFQEIEMFLGGVLGVNNDPPDTISDSVMRDAKGFDDWSFKKKGKKKKKPKVQNTRPKKGEAL